MFTKLHHSMVFRLLVLVFALGLSVWFFCESQCEPVG